MSLLKGKTAVITGASRGIGLSICETYARMGCNIVMVARSGKELEIEAGKICSKSQFNQTVLTYAVDVSCEEELRSAIQDAQHKTGRIDILVNNAGIIGPVGPIETIASSEWTKAIEINLNGTFFGIKAVLPIMKQQGGGRIINFSGGGALLPAPYFDAYSVTKASVVRLTENVALEVKGSNILICAVAPGGVNTKMFEDMMAAGEEKLSKEIWHGFVKRKEQGGDSIEDVQNLLAFLATTQTTELINGRVISAKWDNWSKFEENVAAFDSDIYMMRRILPKDRGYSW